MQSGKLSHHSVLPAAGGTSNGIRRKPAGGAGKREGLE
jgi:hypothetical protein